MGKAEVIWVCYWKRKNILKRLHCAGVGYTR